MRISLSAILVCCAILAGCGTTKWTDTRRTATEQLLISDAMDRAVSKLDFRAVAGKKVYLDSSPLNGVTDSAYLVSLLRQHMLASGCLVMEKREQADYVVEVRAGVVGTDRREVVFGVPATKLAGMVALPGVPTNIIPEMPLVTKTEQRAVTKIAVFAYNRRTGRPVWQSGVMPVESKVKNIWLLGAGPFQRGTIYKGTKFAGERIKIPLITPGKKDREKLGDVSVANEAYFTEPEEQLADSETGPKPKTDAQPKLAEEKKASIPPGGVIPAGHTGAVAPRAAEKADSHPAAPASNHPPLPTQSPAPKAPQPPPGPKGPWE